MGAAAMTASSARGRGSYESLEASYVNSSQKLKIKVRTLIVPALAETTWRARPSRSYATSHRFRRG